MPEGDGATQQARAADRLDRVDFGIQKPQNGCTDLLMLCSQPAADAQAVGPLQTSYTGIAATRCRHPDHYRIGMPRQVLLYF